MDSSQAKIKHKSFGFSTQVVWIEDKAGSLHSEGKPTLRVASPPEFKGEAGVWTPEDLFVAAVEACTMTTFLAFASRLKIPMVSYGSRSEGTLEFVDGGYSFTKIVVRPKIVVSSSDAVELTKKTLEDAHHSCLISNSISSEVTVVPEISVSIA